MWIETVRMILRQLLTSFISTIMPSLYCISIWNIKKSSRSVQQDWSGGDFPPVCSAAPPVCTYDHRDREEGQLDFHFSMMTFFSSCLFCITKVHVNVLYMAKCKNETPQAGCLSKAVPLFPGTEANSSAQFPPLPWRSLKYHHPPPQHDKCAQVIYPMTTICEDCWQSAISQCYSYPFENII